MFGRPCRRIHEHCETGQGHTLCLGLDPGNLAGPQHEVRLVGALYIQLLLHSQTMLLVSMRTANQSVQGKW